MFFPRSVRFPDWRDKKYVICCCSHIGASQACLCVWLLPAGLDETAAFGLRPGNTSSVFYGQSRAGDDLLFCSTRY